jgi:hypothetical protein
MSQVEKGKLGKKKRHPKRTIGPNTGRIVQRGMKRPSGKR